MSVSSKWVRVDVCIRTFIAKKFSQVYLLMYILETGYMNVDVWHLARHYIYRKPCFDAAEESQVLCIDFTWCIARIIPLDWRIISTLNEQEVVLRAWIFVWADSEKWIQSDCNWKEIQFTKKKLVGSSGHKINRQWQMIQ